jgi:hypothetical protein
MAPPRCHAIMPRCRDAVADAPPALMIRARRLPPARKRCRRRHAADAADDSDAAAARPSAAFATRCLAYAEPLVFADAFSPCLLLPLIFRFAFDAADCRRRLIIAMFSPFATYFAFDVYFHASITDAELDRRVLPFADFAAAFAAD